MTFDDGDRDRKVIPRWRDFRSAIRVRELAPIPTNIPQKYEDILNTPERTFAQRKLDWEEHGSLTFASEFVAAALVLKREHEATDAATFVLEHATTQAAKSLAQTVLGLEWHIELPAPPSTPTKIELGNIIRCARSKLRDDPRDAFQWSDLARAYETLGLHDKADHAILMARNLAPNNRFVLRAVSRLHLHRNDFDQSHETLKRSSRLRFDPWLLASEITMAAIAGRTSEFVRQARRIIDSQNVPPIHISELASALATMECDAGNFKGARKLLRASLIDPSENALAQASWFARKQIIDLPQPLIGSLQSREADTWKFSLQGEWAKMLEAGLGWLAIEPFSSRPATMASFIAAVALEDYNSCIAIAEFGLVANPYHFMLTNNMTFALGRLGKISEARKWYKTINPQNISEQEKVTWLATDGLIHFREGNIREGQVLYDQAFQNALTLRDRQLATKVYLFWLIEEVNAKVEGAEKMRQDILAMLATRPLKDPQFFPLVHHFRTFIPRENKNLVISPTSNILSRKQVIYNTFNEDIFSPRQTPPTM